MHRHDVLKFFVTLPISSIIGQFKKKKKKKKEQGEIAAVIRTRAGIESSRACTHEFLSQIQYPSFVSFRFCVLVESKSVSLATFVFCTKFYVKAEMFKTLDIKDAHVGLEINWEE